MYRKKKKKCIGNPAGRRKMSPDANMVLHKRKLSHRNTFYFGKYIIYIFTLKPI